VIRELVFSWEMWVIWYGTAAFVFTIRHLRKGKKEDTSPKWEAILGSPGTETDIQDIPRTQKISLNVEEDVPVPYEGQVVNIRSKPEKPDWMS
jgi:hypothetical protein